MRYSDIAIKKNNNVHTGAKTQFGGLKNGLLIFAYQPLMAGIVTWDPKNDVEKQITIDKTNQSIFFICFY